MKCSPLAHLLSAHLTRYCGKRRQFLKQSASVLTSIVAAHALPGFALGGTSNPATPTLSQEPVTIVGGGLAGLTLAYRLTSMGIPCQIFESQPRLGGRVNTLLHESTMLFAEMGGEFINTNHHHILQLCQELRVPIERIKPKKYGEANALFTVNGKPISKTALQDALDPLAQKVRTDLQHAFPTGHITTPTYHHPNAALQTLDNTTLDAYLKGIPLNPSQHWLLDLLFTTYKAEYGLECDQQSALNMLLLLDVDTPHNVTLVGDEALRVMHGNSRLVEALEAALQAHNVPIFTSYRLDNLQWKAAPTNSGRGTFQLEFTLPDGGTTQHTTNAPVVLALPLPAMKHLCTTSQLPLTAPKKHAFDTLAMGTNTKHLLWFQHRYWAPANEITTDTPAQIFWDTSIKQPGEAGVLTQFMGGKTGATFTGQYHEQIHTLETLSRIFNKPINQLKLERLQTKTIGSVS